MAIIPQTQLFRWNDVEAKSDLTRLRYVLDALPDEPLMRELEAARGRGRDDYPVRAVWNALLAGVVFGHPTIESLRRELLRNAELREVCGFDVASGADAVPKPWNFSRFLATLFRCRAAADAMFDALVDRLKRELPDLGRSLAIDSKAIESAGKPTERGAKPDGRREKDADWGAKTSLRSPTWRCERRHRRRLGRSRRGPPGIARAADESGDGQGRQGVGEGQILVRVQTPPGRGCPARTPSRV